MKIKKINKKIKKNINFFQDPNTAFIHLRKVLSQVNAVWSTFWLHKNVIDVVSFKTFFLVFNCLNDLFNFKGRKRN